MPTIIPKQPKVYPKWTGVALVASSSLLLLAGLSMFVFWLLGSRTADSVAALDAQLGQGQTEEESELEVRVLGYKQKLDDFAQLAASRIYPDNFFPFLEDVTHERVFFTSLSLDPAQSTATLSGEAEDFRVLAEQVAILRASEGLESFTISSIELGEEGGVTFSLTLAFAKSFFATPPSPQESEEEQAL